MNFDVTELLGRLYLSDSGSFFTSLILQNAFLSSAFYLLRFGYVSTTYFSAWLTNYKHKYQNDSEPWMRSETEVFQYGYFGSQMITILAIVILFSQVSPLVSVAGAIFFLVRHIVDAFNLITFHLKETDSSSRIITHLLNWTIALIFVYELCMMCYMAFRKMMLQASILGLMFLISVVAVLVTADDIYDPFNIDGNSSFSLGCNVFSSKFVLKWMQCYSHPLEIGKKSMNIESPDEKKIN